MADTAPEAMREMAEEIFNVDGLITPDQAMIAGQMLQLAARGIEQLRQARDAALNTRPAVLK